MGWLDYILSHRAEVLTLTLEHLWLVGVATLVAVALGVPLGILATRRPALGRAVLGAANVAQTVPSLALFGFLLAVPWLGDRADYLAVFALSLYALLPIVKNTHAGITGVDAAVLESALGMGMTPQQLLWQIELPLASGVILAGVRVATVISVGTATIAAAIGAGGLGEFIFRGVASVNNDLILAGAVPAAALALLADAVLGFIERWFRGSHS